MEPLLRSGSETISPPVPALRLPGDEGKDGSGALGTLFLLALGLGLAVRYALPGEVREMFEVPSLFHVRGVATLLGAVAASIVLHELGHLMAALMMNFRIMGLALGPFRVARLSGRWQLRFTPRTLFSGSVSAIPKSMKMWRRRMLVVVAGGPLATLATGALAAWLVVTHAFGAPTSGFLGAMTQLSTFIFVLGLIPNKRSSRVRNDARLICVLRRDSREAREILFYHLLTQLELAGTRPGEYPAELMQQLAGAEGRPELMLFSAQKIAMWALDRGQMATAEAWDRRCLELSEACQPALRNVALAQSAWLDVLVRERAGEARDKLAQVDWETLSPAWLMHRSRAVYYLTEGNVPECLAEITRAQYAFPNGSPVYTFERGLLTQLHRMALNVRPPELAKRCAA